MSDQFFDILEQEITPGCWIAQAYSLGRCPAIKLSKVMAFTAKGKVRVQGFERYVEHWKDGQPSAEPIVQWSRTAVSTLAFTERMVVVSTIPNSLHQYIEETFGGDPHSDPIEEI